MVTEKNGDRRKYTPIVKALREHLGKKYNVWYTGSSWAVVRRKCPVLRIFTNDLVMFYFSTGCIDVHNPDIYPLIKKFAESNIGRRWFSEIRKNYPKQR